MPTPVIRFPLVSRCILAGGLLAAGLAAGLLVSARWAGPAGAAAAAAVWVWTGRTLELHPDALTLRGSFWFDTVRVVRRRTVTQLYCVATPLLRLADCRVAVLFTPGGRIWLPGLRRADAARLVAWYRA